MQSKRKSSTTEGEDEIQEPKLGRLDTLKNLQAEWGSQGIDVRLEVVPGVGHDSAGLHRLAEDFFSSLVGKIGVQ